MPSKIDSSPQYVGRFAPSPSGQLHFGSLVTALASYLDARHHNGQWLVRMEDIDAPRCLPGVDSDILLTLECHGLHWDGSVLYQQQQHTRYQAKLDSLLADKSAYFCACTRKQIKANGGHDNHYCRDLGLTAQSETESASDTRSLAIRLKLDCQLDAFDDGIMGGVDKTGALSVVNSVAHSTSSGLVEAERHTVKRSNNSNSNDDSISASRVTPLSTAPEDVVIKRSDGLFAYNFVVALDDEYQGVTDIIRGSDLLNITPLQRAIYRSLGCYVPKYGHIPVAAVSPGRKLSKQNHAAPINNKNVLENIVNGLSFLGQGDYHANEFEDATQLLTMAISRWDRKLVPKIAEIIVGKHESTYYSHPL
ncbi:MULTISPECIES: glutamate--tRNA ligase family protein [Alteromonas]|jgi:glutamyl-Q tRNA(Asp) synthetase|uniref:Glutamate--tRNA ligase family protein n=1 Tax=Alteromonas stellipolaris TaxID=233316 RepID=A0AAW7Z9N8_9ALTE|nr:MULTISPECIES: glutamate--tRNA ligase family protein [Alteromonas]AMJ92150.1 glutamyl-Q tRNA(Asp) ligase [Alteromonas sp. Mac2]AMJ75868.1 glutamyl-Q tRNA(Asp) ligase [Alteromonas stellipolaris]AMJ88294.1 glutamyl-Q tRNA(Asp) ligase [Alteromonas sp. Mac1]ANB20987.1 glutamyl-Q tRNA(Asp) ligase [Alteromonas stellipolaris]ANB25135.1 glutamyl-Q tRNA(Asp) ligase [Alteromonas stellipolaris]